MPGGALRVVMGRGRSALDTRAALRAWQRAAAQQPGQARVFVYFGSGLQYVYQIRDWLAPLSALAERVPVAVVVREPQVALAVKALTTLPVLLARWLADVDALMNTYLPDVVLYVNQNVSNFDLLAYARPQHVFLSHGESDKVYMVSNQAKAYDVTFVAGRAAVDRYRAALHDFDTETKLRVIGRPQLHVDEDAPADLPATQLPQTVVYAPTTEGSAAPMEYGSLASHGVAMTRALLDSGRFRVIFRPHPQAGRRLASHAAAVRQITALLNAAPGGHYVDATLRFGWQRDVADALICDISAVAVDWLPTGKPLVITRPVQPLAPILDGGMLASMPLLTADRASEVETALAHAGEPEELARMRQWSDYYFAPGDVQTFIDAVLELAGVDAPGGTPE
ncbi:MAG: hypothetical protein R2720_01535 [Candidatus Nanopelagicales bacterium]